MKIDGQWIITRDNDYNRNKKAGTLDSLDRNEKGTCSPDYDEKNPLKRGSENVEEFRMLDDDENVIYTGLCYTDFGEECFRPLDDFGTPNWGCSYIEYKQNGVWEAI